MIHGDRVTLRPIRLDDLPFLRMWHADPAVMTGRAIPEPLVAEAAFEAELGGRFASFDDAGYLIIEADDRPIGRIDFEHLDARHGAVEIALYIGDLSGRGRGYASDAVRALTRYLFEQRAVHRVELTVVESNDRARKLYESVGFSTEGVLRDHVHFDGRFHDELVMAMFPDTMRSAGRSGCQESKL
jgi:[ribosomal protein S5]-alanine N-acetyltransferase